MRLSRRAVLRMGGGLGLTSVLAPTLAAPALAMPAPAAPSLVGMKELTARTLSFDCCNTGESLKNVTYWAEGRYIPDALARINYALRDYRSGDVFPIEPRVLDLLHQLGRTLETKGRFELYSGYRSPKTNAMLRRNDPEVSSHSLHMKGEAVDITLPGRSVRRLRDAALAMQVGGVGYYPDAAFVHVDVGRVRKWVGFG
jgi:uncharacterized protein YcbK (DUF882 family)